MSERAACEARLKLPPEAPMERERLWAKAYARTCFSAGSPGFSARDFPEKAEMVSTWQVEGVDCVATWECGGTAWADL